MPLQEKAIPDDPMLETFIYAAATPTRYWAVELVRGGGEVAVGSWMVFVWSYVQPYTIGSSVLVLML